MLWLKADDNDPDDFVSLHPRTLRAQIWCEEQGINPRDIKMENAEAELLSQWPPHSLLRLRPQVR